MSVTITPAALLDLLEAQAESVVLPHARAASALRTAFAARQRTEVWKPAAAVSWAEWTQSLYAARIVDGQETRLLLNAVQEHSLWRAVIADDPPREALGSLDAMAELASSALERAAQWNALGRLRGSTTHEDTRQFARWAEEFLRRCERDGYLSQSLLAAALTAAAEAGTLALPSVLRLVGFGERTPAQASLLAALRVRGTEMLTLELQWDGPATEPEVVTAADPRTELRAAARRLRASLEAAEHKPRRIAVLVPGLADERLELEAVFREVLAPELQWVGADLSSVPWESSAGEPLRSVAMIADALDLVRWVAGPLPQGRVSSLLLSPYLSADREAAALLDAELRQKEKQLRPEFSLEALLQAVKRRGGVPEWLERFHTEVKRGGDLTRPRGHAEWTDLLRRLVQAAGWPGTRPLSALEFEATRAWEGALDIVATLDFSGQRAMLRDTIAALERQTHAATLNVSPHGAAIQVMRPEEAEGCWFDEVLSLRSTDANLPALESPHPLLSWQLQSALGMPGTDPAASYARAQAALRRLLASTGRAVFSYARENADGALRPSPLLAEAATLSEAEMPSPAKSVEYEEHADAEDLPALPKTQVRGGASVLKSQAACGFRAFAEFRLGSATPEMREEGFDARDSGTRVHAALQALWKRLGGQEELRRLTEEDPEALQSLIHACARDAVMHRLQTQSAWDEAYADLQTERLATVLTAWLQHELQRGPFTVLDTEETQTISVGPLTLELRFDRVDRVEGGFLLIDYKTGAAGKPGEWEGERPDEPQLPLYALHYEAEEIAGLAFAKIVAGEKMAWEGVATTDGVLPIKPRHVGELNERIGAWREVLTQLAQQFADGHVEADPKRYPATCEHCGQRLLCRLDVAGLRGVDSDAEDGADVQ